MQMTGCWVVANTPCITPNTPPNNYTIAQQHKGSQSRYLHEASIKFGNCRWGRTFHPLCRAWPWPECLARLFGIFVRCLGFYYDISAITVVRAPHRRGTLSGTSGERGETGAGTRILISSDRVSSLAWIQRRRQLRLPGMAQCYTELQHYCYIQTGSLGLCFTLQLTRDTWHVGGHVASTRDGNTGHVKQREPETEALWRRGVGSNQDKAAQPSVTSP